MDKNNEIEDQEILPSSGAVENILPTTNEEEMKKLIKQLRSVYDNVDMNIYNSTKNVNLNTIISYIKDGEVHSFMDNYDEEGLKKQEKLN